MQNDIPSKKLKNGLLSDSFILIMYIGSSGGLSALHVSGVVLVHDTLSNDSPSNDARFKHKLCKHAYFM